jgi:hypothetical protein
MRLRLNDTGGVESVVFYSRSRESLRNLFSWFVNRNFKYTKYLCDHTTQVYSRDLLVSPSYCSRCSGLQLSESHCECYTVLQAVENFLAVPAISSHSRLYSLQPAEPPPRSLEL